MFKVSKKAQYGLRAMIFLANVQKTKKPYSTKEISQKEGIPFDFLEKIIGQLERAGLVNSKKGVFGGYLLGSHPKKIAIGRITEILEGRISPVSCSFCAKQKKCLSKNVWDKVKESLQKTLNSITLADLIE